MAHIGRRRGKWVVEYQDSTGRPRSVPCGTRREAKARLQEKELAEYLRPSRPLVNILALDTREWLGQLFDEPFPLIFGLGLAVCRRCGGGVRLLGTRESPESPIPCSWCHSSCIPLDDGWWVRLANRVRRACQRDRTLIPTLKAHWDAVHDGAPLPCLPEPFSWLNHVWELPGKPSGRPFAPLLHYLRAHAADRLRSARVTQKKIVEILGQPDREKRRQLYGSLPDRTRRFLGSYGPWLSDVDFIAGPEELRRSVRWAHRQWSNPRARWRGERVRRRAGPRPFGMGLQKRSFARKKARKIRLA